MEPTLKNELNKLKQIKGKGFGLSKDDYENLIFLRFRKIVQPSRRKMQENG